MANHSVTGTISYSGTTTTTDQDILTLSGWNTTRGGRIMSVRVTNLDDTYDLYVRTDATTATAAVGDGVMVVPPKATMRVPCESAGFGTGTVTVRLIAEAACLYQVAADQS